MKPTRSTPARQHSNAASTNVPSTPYLTRCSTITNPSTPLYVTESRRISQSRRIVKIPIIKVGKISKKRRREMLQRLQPATRAKIEAVTSSRTKFSKEERLAIIKSLRQPIPPKKSSSTATPGTALSQKTKKSQHAAALLPAVVSPTVRDRNLKPSSPVRGIETLPIKTRGIQFSNNLEEQKTRAITKTNASSTTGANSTSSSQSVSTAASSHKGGEDCMKATVTFHEFVSRRGYLVRFIKAFNRSTLLKEKDELVETVLNHILEDWVKATNDQSSIESKRQYLAKYLIAQTRPPPLSTSSTPTKNLQHGVPLVSPSSQQKDGKQTFLDTGDDNASPPGREGAASDSHNATSATDVELRPRSSKGEVWSTLLDTAKKFNDTLCSTRSADAVRKKVKKNELGRANLKRDDKHNSKASLSFRQFVSDDGYLTKYIRACNRMAPDHKKELREAIIRRAIGAWMKVTDGDINDEMKRQRLGRMFALEAEAKFVCPSFRSKGFQSTKIERDELIARTDDGSSNSKHQKMIDLAKSVVIDLYSSKLGSIGGLPVCCDWPTGCIAPYVNLDRPGVTRVYFGKKVEDPKRLAKKGIATKVKANTKKRKRFDHDDDEYIRLNCYGNKIGSATVGTDPRFMRTHPFTDGIEQLGKYLQEVIAIHYPELASSMTLKPLNHCTVLPYMGSEFLSDDVNESSMNFHCDNVYDLHGRYSPNRNSQIDRTPTIIFTVGDTRSLGFKRRLVDERPYITKDGKTKISRKWRTSILPGEQIEFIELDEGSIMIIHPLDEQPLYRFGEERRSQYRHGGVKVKEGLSCAFVYRAVFNDHLFHKETHAKKLNRRDIKYLNGREKRMKRDETRVELLDRKRSSFSIDDADLRLKRVFANWCIGRPGWDRGTKTLFSSPN